MKTKKYRRNIGKLGLKKRVCRLNPTKQQNFMMISLPDTLPAFLAKCNKCGKKLTAVFYVSYVAKLFSLDGTNAMKISLVDNTVAICRRCFHK